jgi:hypothetical protein
MLQPPSQEKSPSSQGGFDLSGLGAPRVLAGYCNRKPKRPSPQVGRLAERRGNRRGSITKFVIENDQNTWNKISQTAHYVMVLN